MDGRKGLVWIKATGITIRTIDADGSGVWFSIRSVSVGDAHDMQPKLTEFRGEKEVRTKYSRNELELVCIAQIWYEQYLSL